MPLPKIATAGRGSAVPVDGDGKHNFSDLKLKALSRRVEFVLNINDRVEVQKKN